MEKIKFVNFSSVTAIYDSPKWENFDDSTTFFHGQQSKDIDEIMENHNWKNTMEKIKDKRLDLWEQLSRM